MKCFKWIVEDSAIFGKILRPVVQIAIKDVKGKWKFVLAYVDSGADISVFQRSFGELLGIEIEKGRFAKFSGIAKSFLDTYIHNVEIKIGEEAFKADVAFCKSHETATPNLLGRKDIFNIFEVKFNNVRKETCFIKKS